MEYGINRPSICLQRARGPSLRSSGSCACCCGLLIDLRGRALRALEPKEREILGSVSRSRCALCLLLTTTSSDNNNDNNKQNNKDDINIHNTTMLIIVAIHTSSSTMPFLTSSNAILSLSLLLYVP